MHLDLWTLSLQAINVLVLVWLLRRFFWKPVAAAIARRREEARSMLAAARAKREDAAKALADIEATRAGFAAEREAILQAAHSDAADARASALATAKADADALREAAKTAVDRAAAAAAKARADEVSALAVEIAGRLAARLDGAAVRDTFLAWLVHEIETMPETARRAIADGGDGTLDLVSAAPLDDAEAARVRRAVATALGAEPTFAFATDAALIAGFELRSPHFVLRNSWRADLDRIREELLDGA